MMIIKKLLKKIPKQKTIEFYLLNRKLKEKKSIIDKSA